MNFFSRIWNIIQGRANTLVESVENPEDQLRLFVTSLDSEMSKLRQAVAAAMTEEKKLKMKIEGLLLQAHDWEKKAILALNKGDEDLAREALVRKSDAKAEAMRLKNEWERQAESVAKLQESMIATQQKTEKAKREYTVLLARYRTAKTQQSINKQLNGVADNTSGNMIEALNDRILKIEAESQADMQLLGAGGASELDARFAKLENESRGDEALAQLKAKLNASSAPAKMIEVKKKAN